MPVKRVQSTKGAYMDMFIGMTLVVSMPYLLSSFVLIFAKSFASFLA